MGILEDFRLDGKTALVTGASQGLGRGMAEGLAEAGADVVVVSRSADRLEAVRDTIRGLGRICEAIPTDIGDVSVISGMVEAAKAVTGRIDILVNNAGIAHIGNLENTSKADFDRLLSVNVKGVYNMLSAVLPAMKARRSGVILNMASVASSVGISDRFAYSATKGAVLTMT